MPAISTLSRRLMAEIIVDARGKLCPAPLIMTKKALGEIAKGDSLRVLIDNEVSKNNVERFLSDNGFVSTCVAAGALFTLAVAKTKSDLVRTDAESYCEIPARPPNGRVILISGETMGSGSDELGAILMKAFINTIREVTPLPSNIIFYNSGVLLAVEGSGLVLSLKELEARGVSILVCGTCVNYYGKADRVRVGVISNMYTILETLSAANGIIKP
jgi:selenium metabolism protein YedF